MNRHPQLWAALLAARRGAEVLGAETGQRQDGRHSLQAGATPDFDRVIEAAILEELDRHFPDHNVISEESSPEFVPKPRWIVDPLDGAINYRNGVPHYSISIAFEGSQSKDVSVVFHPPADTMYVAVEGEGAFANGRRLSVSDTTAVEDALVVTGFDPMTMKAQDFRNFRSLIEETQGLRRFGSAAADLSMVAAGQFDVFFERVLRLWDTAAGIQIIDEAGGKVTRIQRLDDDNSEMVLASNPHIHQELVSLISSGPVSTN